MSWDTTITVPVALLALMASLIAFPILAIFRAWMVPGPFYKQALQRGDEERQAKNDALDANKELIKANNLLLQRDDLSITTLQEIRDYIHRHDQIGGGPP